jgi:hypothetical protein
MTTVRGWECSLLVESLPSMCEALGLIPSTVMTTTLKYYSER